MPLSMDAAISIAKNDLLKANFLQEKIDFIVSKMVSIAQHDLDLDSWNVDMGNRYFEATFVNGGNIMVFRYGIDRGLSFSTTQETSGFFDWLVNF